MTWQPLALEMGVCGWIVVLLVGDLVTGTARKAQLWKLALLGMVVFAGLLLWQGSWVGQPLSLSVPIAQVGVPSPGAMFVFDRFAFLWKGLFLFTVFVIVLMTRTFTKSLTANIGEFYLLVFSALLGMLVLASVNDLLLLFIALELLTFSLYVMAAYLRTDARSIEAGLKYLILGAISSGFLVYGISLLYGAAGSTSFPAIRALLQGAGTTAPPAALTLAGMLLVLAALGFKIAIVPFHLWVPDVYEGAPTPVVALLAAGSKMAGVVVLLRLLYDVFLPAQALWGSLLAVLAAITMCYGNLAAIPQTNIKRLLGYSSIGHAGYLVMGLSTATLAGASAVGFYLVAYLLSTLCAFFVVVLAFHAVGSDNLEDYNGLARRSPLLAGAMFVALLSLAGVPPLVGFAGKLFVLIATAEIHRMWLVAIGAGNVVIALYYYLMVVRRMYLLPARTSQPIDVDRFSRVMLLVLVGGMVLIGIVQQPVLQLIQSTMTFAG